MTRPTIGAHRLRVAAADLLGRRRGWRRSPPRRSPASSSPPPSAAEALALDDRGRVAALGDQHVEDLARRARGDRLVADEPDELRQRLRRDLRRRRVRVRADPRAQLARPSSRARAGASAVADAPRSSRPSAARTRAAGRGRPRARTRRDSAPRAPPAARAARRARRRASPASARSGRGRARGSSGSRAPPPWSAASDQPPARRIEVQRLLHDRLARLEQRDLARDLGVDAALEEAEGVHVLELGLGARARVVPAGRTETLASQRSEPSSMFTSLTPSWRSVTRSRLQPLARLLGRVDVGLGDDLGQRRAAAVVVDDRRVRAVDAARLADVDELRRVLLEVDRGAAARRPAGRPRRAGCRTGRSGSSWPGRDRSSSCGGRSTAARSRSRARAPIISAEVDRLRRWPPAASRAGRGRPGRCACSAARRRSARSRRTSSSACRAGRGSPGR